MTDTTTAPAAPAAPVPTPPVPTPPAAAPTAPVPPAEPTQFTPPASQEEMNRIVADRVARERAKFSNYDELTQKAAELDNIREAQKTEAQKNADAIAAAQKAAADAQADAVRYRVAAAKGIGEDYFDLLGSGDEVTVTTRADKLAPMIAALAENTQLKTELEALRQGKPAPLTSRPIPALQPGATPQGQQSEDDVLMHSLFGPNS